MLLFSTTLKIKDTMTQNDFIGLIIQWNQSSPHKENIIPNIVWKEERNIQFGNDKLWLRIEEYRNRNIVAVRYRKVEDDGTSWDTDYVMNFNEHKMEIGLYRSFSEESMQMYREYSAPYFIKTIIEAGFVEDDGALAVSWKPHFIEDEDIGLLADIINRKTQYRLPVVYVSKKRDDTDPVDVGKLANKLKGVAHVLVEKGDWQDYRLRELCRDQNEYHGTIGIYYPSKMQNHKEFYSRWAYYGFNNFLMSKVINHVVQYSNSKIIDPLYTFQGVMNALLTDKYKSQRKEKTDALSEASEARTLVDTTDAEIREYQRQIRELTEENKSLSAENQALRAGFDEKERDDEPLLYLGEEDEFYEGEIRETVLYTLENVASGLPKHNCRRKDILEDVIKHNKYNKTVHQKHEEIKRILKGFKKVTPRMKKDLEDLGFTLTEDGKHYKMTYGDGRYTTSLAKTPSDSRSGGNMASDISNQMF